MRIIFSRKGFDSAAGRGASPIVDGRPVTLPIPRNEGPSRTSYGDLGLGELALAASRGLYGPDSLCHHDPMFLPDGRTILGQCSAAQTHLANNGVGVGDLFLFFGLFKAPGEGRHHRIFGYLRVEEVLPLASMDKSLLDELQQLDFPHALGMHASNGNDTIYRGTGGKARSASDMLRLTAPGGPTSRWRIPQWLQETRMTFHPGEGRWKVPGELKSAGRGQEFVADIGTRQDARDWAEAVIAEIEG